MNFFIGARGGFGELPLNGLAAHCPPFSAPYGSHFWSLRTLALVLPEGFDATEIPNQVQKPSRIVRRFAPGTKCAGRLNRPVIARRVVTCARTRAKDADRREP